MLTFVPYSPEDLRKVDLQPAQASWRERFMDLGYARSLDVPGRAWTGLDDAGRVAGCAGFAPQWEGRVIAWAVFGKVPRPAWARVVAKVRKEMRALEARRVEITVPVGFGAGCRLAEILGFNIEGRMNAFGPDGADHYLYSKVA